MSLAGETTFGRYEPLFEIARGGMACVYAARSTGEGGFARTVAVKHMLAELDEPAFVDLFLDEARVAAAVHSPYVVQTFDVGRASDGRPFLVMELVVGVSLGRLMFELGRREREMPLGVLVRIAGDAARGLHHAHETTGPDATPLGVVHRDVSPQNVLVDEHGRARIADFGIARALEKRGITLPGQRRGKPSYMSPEQSRGRTVDRRADVFSLGVVAWEAIAGRAFPAHDAPIPDLHELRPEVPAALSAVVSRALSREPSGRQRTAAELGAAIEASGVTPASEADVAALVRELFEETLERLRHPERASSDAPEAIAVAPAPSPASAPRTAPLTPAAPKRMRTARAVAAVVAGAALLGGAGFVVARSGTGAEAPAAADAAVADAGEPTVARDEAPETETEPPPPRAVPAPARGARPSATERSRPAPETPAAEEARDPPEAPSDDRHGLPFGLDEFPTSAEP